MVKWWFLTQVVWGQPILYIPHFLTLIWQIHLVTYPGATPTPFCLVRRANILSEGLPISHARFAFPHSSAVSNPSRVMGLIWVDGMIAGGGDSGNVFFLVKRQTSWVLSFPYPLDSEIWLLLWSGQQRQSVKARALKTGGRRIVSLRTEPSLGLPTSKCLFWEIITPMIKPLSIGHYLTCSWNHL